MKWKGHCGSLWKYITYDINNALEVLHLQNVYDEKTLEDCAVLEQTSRDCNIAHPEIIMYSFDSTFIEEANQVPGVEDISIPVRNILMKYSRYFIASNIQFLFESFLCFMI